MNISCTICSDLFVPAGEIYITKCGHMFHFHCLINWLQRSPTCPQCRHRSTEKTIHKVYFNLANTDGTTEDAGTLQNKLNDLQFQMTLRQKELKNLEEKYQKSKLQNNGLRTEVKDLEDKLKGHQSSIHALKDKMAYFKSKANETDRLTGEITRLKNQIKDMENIGIAMKGTREEVNEMLRNEKNVESLALLTAILKKSLAEAERRKREMEHNLKKAQNDASMYRKECSILECQNNDMRKELQQLKSSYESEKQYLRNKIVDLDKKINSTDNVNITNSSLTRIISESPINFNRKPHLTPFEDVSNEAASPSLAEKVQKIVESDSPYLPVKSSNVAMDYTSILNTKFQSKSSSKSGFTIFKPAPTSMEIIRSCSSTNGAVYNGLGGTSKEEIYPSPKPIQTGLKRPKSSSSVTSTKFRKLAPASSTKATNFFSQKGSQ